MFQKFIPDPYPTYKKGWAHGRYSILTIFWFKIISYHRDDNIQVVNEVTNVSRIPVE